MTTKPTFDKVVQDGARIVSWVILYALAIGLVIFLVLTAYDPNAPTYRKPYAPTSEVTR